MVLRFADNFLVSVVRPDACVSGGFPFVRFFSYRILLSYSDDVNISYCFVVGSERTEDNRSVTPSVIHVGCPGRFVGSKRVARKKNGYPTLAVTCDHGKEIINNNYYKRDNSVVSPVLPKLCRQA